MLLITLWRRRHPELQNMALRDSSYVRLSVSLLSVLFCRKFDLPKEGGRPLFGETGCTRGQTPHTVMKEAVHWESCPGFVSLCIWHAVIQSVLTWLTTEAKWKHQSDFGTLKLKKSLIVVSSIYSSWQTASVRTESPGFSYILLMSSDLY